MELQLKSIIDALALLSITDARRKRPPKRLSQRPNDVYINRSSQFAGQLSRCRRLFDQGYVCMYQGLIE